MFKRVLGEKIKNDDTRCKNDFLAQLHESSQNKNFASQKRTRAFQKEYILTKSVNSFDCCDEISTLNPGQKEFLTQKKLRYEAK